MKATLGIQIAYIYARSLGITRRLTLNEIVTCYKEYCLLFNQLN
jgi:hypothetical protein